ncbi:DUF1997 domain-containing protein [Thermostichus vulcanus]|uniref:DUF1997 domain-containing protein n=1 Tax=Thermostichus vulcanus str. 'Rupite' TaxID=2813851 RepID=A0ABT0CFZ1_THEVL|nr:DUF1997 domain-containing protein [Thermostichus vulcanus]MCJ2544662.1 DUF1997 domain-containing protein [Thermostichus vulcanus str. 'Rupite']
MSIASSKPVVPASDCQDCDGASEQPQLAKVQQDFVPLTRLDLQATRRGQVDLETDRETLAHYLRGHSQWIQHCFRPLRVEALSADSYKLEFFRIGGLGFELEPCFGVKIWPDENDVFRLTSIELPGDAALPYHVDCRAAFRLEELSGSPDLPPLTRVHWDLHLDIWLTLPGFLQVLPHKLVRRVANQVVQQVTRSMSDRLTHNVCSDFYHSIDRPGHRYRLVSVG